MFYLVKLFFQLCCHFYTFGGVLTYVELQGKDDDEIEKIETKKGNLFNVVDDNSIELLKKSLAKGRKEQLLFSMNERKRFQWWYAESLATLILLIKIWI